MTVHDRITSCIITSMCILSSVTLAEIPNGPYFGQRLPGVMPEVFAPDVLPLVSQLTWGGTFSPQGDEYFFTASNAPAYTWSRIMMTRMDSHGQWSTPTVAPFSGIYIDWLAQFAPNGNRLFICSGRAPANGWRLDIFSVDRVGDSWSSQPVNLPINDVAQSDYASPSANNGTLYFGSGRSAGYGVYRSVLENGQYQTPQPFDTDICNQYSPSVPCIAPDESYMIFSSNYRTQTSVEDLYITFHNPDNTWTTPRMLSWAVNTPNSREWLPRISAKGDLLFYLSARVDDDDFYWVSTKAFLPDPNGPIEILSSGQRFASINCAISYANVGDTIVIGPGLYQESIVLNDNDLTLRSVDPNDPYYVGGTVIQGDVNVPVLTLDNNAEVCKIAGLTLRAGAVGISGIATNATIRNCRIMDNVTHGMELSDKSSPHLLNCLITANGQSGIKMLPGSGRGNPPCKPVIENCIIIDNNESSIDGGEPIIIDSIID